MKNLNLNVIFLFALFFLFSFQEDREKPAIDIEKVRNDILSSTENTIPEDFLSRLRKNRFLVIYDQDFCFVHVAYKTFLSESQMKQSMVAIYRFLKNDWVLVKLLPYFYNLTRIDSNEIIFLSDNQVCGLEGNCNTFTEIDFFKDDSFAPIAKYSGFDKTVYLMNKFSKGDRNDVSKFVGDTVAKTYEVSKFEMIGPSNFSYTLMQQGAVLKSVRDSLSFADFSKTTIVSRKVTPDK